MRQESGRSLIELLGVLAIAGIMAVASIAVYNNIRNRQLRTIATAEIEKIAENTKMLLSQTGDYTGLSVDYLIQSGALKNADAPIGSDDWSVTSSVDGHEFSINLTGLSESECLYFITAKLNWITFVKTNGYDSGNGEYCFKTGDNQVSLIVQ